MISGVPQRVQLFQLVFTALSHEPPLAVDALVVKKKSAPVLATVNVCGSGLAAPAVIVKLIGLICWKTSAPTTTLTGTLTLLPDVWITTSPENVPATSPSPGRFAFTMETLIVEGAVPLWTEVVSQF